MFDVKGFVEKHLAQPVNSVFKLDKRRLTFGFVAYGTDESMFFPVIDVEKAGDVRAEAAAWADKKGGESGRNNPRVAINVIVYKGTSFVRESSNWDGDSVFNVVNGNIPHDTVEEAPDGTMIEQREWKVRPPFDMLSASVSPMSSDWYPEIETIEGFPFGEDVFVLLYAKKDPTFVDEDESTWNDYNSYEIKNGERAGERAPTYIDYVKEVFKTENEVRAWLKQNGHEIGGDFADGASPSAGAFSYDPPVALAEDAALLEEWDGMILPELVSSLTPLMGESKPNKLKAITKILKDWGDVPGVDAKYLNGMLAALEASEPPF